MAPKNIDECVKKLLMDPDFKPIAGKSKTDSAYIVCKRHTKILEPTKNELELNNYVEVIAVNEKLNLEKITNEDLDKINKLTVKSVSKEDVVIYPALLIDDQTTRNATKYPKEFQKTILSLPVGEGNFIGAPFLLGDEKDHQDTAASQLGRIFDAWQVIDKEGHHGTMGKIYILKTKENVETIKKIDSGVLKEVSIATKVELPICSLCNQDIRTCKHVKGQEGCYVTMTGAGFCGEVSLVAIPGSTKAKILNDDAFAGYVKTESMEGFIKEQLKMFKEATVDELHKILSASQGVGAKVLKVTGLTKLKSLLTKVMTSGAAKLIGKGLSSGAVRGISRLAGGMTFMIATSLGAIAVKGISSLFKSRRKGKSLSLLKGFALSIDDEEKRNLQAETIEYNEEDSNLLDALHIIPMGKKIDELDEEEMKQMDLNIEEWITTFNKVRVSGNTEGLLTPVVALAIGGAKFTLPAILATSLGYIALKAMVALIKAKKKGKALTSKAVDLSLKKSFEAVEFDDEDNTLIDALGIIPAGKKFDDLNETELKQMDLNIEEWLTIFSDVNEQIKDYKENDVVIFDDKNEESFYLVDEKQGEGLFPVRPQDNDPAASEKIKHDVQLSGTLNDINVRITKANELVTKYASRYITKLVPISSEPVPRIEQGMKGEDTDFIVDTFYKNIEAIDSNLLGLEGLLKFNIEEKKLTYKGDKKKISEVTLFMYEKIENILKRIYQLQGRFNLEDIEKDKLVNETVRLGTIANVIKFDNKEDVKTLFFNMTLDQIKTLNSSFFTEGSKIMQNKEIPKDLKDPNGKKKVETKPKDVKPVSIMDYKKNQK